MYSINFSNESAANTNFVIFQEYQGDQQNLHSLAWKTRSVGPGQEGSFDWTQEYNFVWSETGQLKPGVKFAARQSVPTDPNGRNEISFGVYSGKGNFSQLSQGIYKKWFFIKEEASVPLGEYAVGIGMFEKAACVAQAAPNLILELSAGPKYYVTTGPYTDGEVLDTSGIHKVLLDFPPFGGSINVTLQENGIIKLS